MSTRAAFVVISPLLVLHITALSADGWRDHTRSHTAQPRTAILLPHLRHKQHQQHHHHQAMGSRRRFSMEREDLYVSSDSVAREELMGLFNVEGLQDSGGPLTTTTSTYTQKNVFKDHHEKSSIWGEDGFCVLLICLTVFIILFTCLMVLHRLKEKDRLVGLKKPSLASRAVQLTPVHGPPLSLQSSMVQAEPATQPSASLSSAPYCRITVPDSGFGETRVSQPEPQGRTELKPPVSCVHSPFRMKSVAGLQERRGSNVSLVLDMSALGAVEPLSAGGAVTPREHACQEYLQTAGRVLSRQRLRDLALDAQALHAEFAEIPMNFVDQRELDVPNHGSKNRYKTILPNPHSRVLLKSKNSKEPLSSYINANYIRGYLGDERVFIATQGPMINTVNDFWHMVWQENCPVIVMITKLKEKNEKCVLYWPEKRGIYGKVEVCVDSVKEGDHYIVRSLTLMRGAQSHKVLHYWYTCWPDHKTPESAGPLLQLVKEVEEERRAATSTGPVIVHCSAGIGRTGCFVATSVGCRQLENEGVVDVLGIVCQLRTDRGGMIQTEEQYEFLHHALSLYESRLQPE